MEAVEVVVLGLQTILEAVVLAEWLLYQYLARQFLD
jgi:hypothetical protein